MGLILGGASAHDLILDGQSVALYVGGNPPTKVWPTRERVQITLGTGLQARDQLRAALSDRGLDYQTVTEIPFDIELVGSGSTESMFRDCSALTSAPAMDTGQVTKMRDMFHSCSSLTSAPAMDTGQVTDMYGMFYSCLSLAHVPDLDTAQVTNMLYMLHNCSSLTDGNVRLIGKHPHVLTSQMITGSGLTREPWYTADGKPIDVYEVSQSRAWGDGRVYTLVTVKVPAGETWQVRIQGTVTETSSTSTYWPNFRIGTADSGRYGRNAAVDFSGTITAANSTIAMVTNSGTNSSFVGTVTIEI